MSDISSEQWPASNRNGGRLRIGIAGRHRRNPQPSCSWNSRIRLKSATPSVMRLIRDCMIKFPIMMLAGQIALVLAAAFLGAAFYINVAEQPARLGLDDKSLLKEWKPSYARGFAMQGSLAVVSGVMGLLEAWLTNDWRWIFGAALILASWPYTLIGMPTNNKLKGKSENDAGATSRRMIETWGRLHAARTALGIAATLAYLWALN